MDEPGTEVRIAYPDWHVGDGDPPIVVGQRWRPTVVAQPPSRRAAARAWLRSAPTPSEEAGGPASLRPVEGEPAEHRVVADVVATSDAGGPWTVLGAGPWRLAASGSWAGRVVGRAVLRHAPWQLDDGKLLALATQDVEVVAIDLLVGRWRRSRIVPGDRVLFGWEPPVAVPDTHALGISPPSGVLVVTCRRVG